MQRVFIFFFAAIEWGAWELKVLTLDRRRGHRIRANGLISPPLAVLPTDWAHGIQSHRGCNRNDYKLQAILRASLRLRPNCAFASILSFETWSFFALFLASHEKACSGYFWKLFKIQFCSIILHFGEHILCSADSVYVVGPPKRESWTEISIPSAVSAADDENNSYNSWTRAQTPWCFAPTPKSERENTL